MQNRIKELMDYAATLVRTSPDPNCFVNSGAKYLGLDPNDVRELGGLMEQTAFIAAATLGFEMARKKGEIMTFESTACIGEKEITCPACERAFTVPIDRIDLYIGVAPAIVLGIVKEDAPVGRTVGECVCGRLVDDFVYLKDISVDKLLEG